MAEYGGVDVNHPLIKQTVENMTKRGETREQIMKITGMPHEVVDRIQREAKKKK